MAVNIKKDFGDTRERKTDLSTLVYGKIPPQAPELEEAVLGALLLEKDKIDSVATVLPTPDNFYVDANQKIYSAILQLKRTGAVVDLLTVTEQLRKQGELEIVGGAYYLTKLTMSVVSSAHVEAHAKIVKEKFIAREIIRIAGKAISDAYEDSTDVFELGDLVLKDYVELIHNDTGGTVHMSQVMKESIDGIQQQKDAPTGFNGLDTGTSKLNEITNGWQKTDLIILAARPSVGKTALGLTFAYAASSSTITETASGPGVFFSYEMPRKQLGNRMLSTRAEIPLYQLRSGEVSDDEMQKLIASASGMSRLPFYINDNSSLDIDRLISTIHTYKRKYNIQWVIIDYLQLVPPSKDKKGNREQEVSDISRKLKRCAKELEIPIIALAQINRGVETRADKRPMVSDLRESGAVEQDADIIMLIYTEQDGNTGEVKHRIRIGKNRNGVTDDIELEFISAIQKWRDINMPFHSLKEQNARAGFQPMQVSGDKLRNFFEVDKDENEDLGGWQDT